MKVLLYSDKTFRPITLTCVDVAVVERNKRIPVTLVEYNGKRYPLFFDVGVDINGESVLISKRIYVN